MKSNPVKSAAALLVLLAVFLSAACGKRPVQETPQTVQLPTGEYAVMVPVYALVSEKTPEGSFTYGGFVFDRSGKLLEKKVSGDKEGNYVYRYREDGKTEFITFTSEAGYEETEFAYNDEGRIAMKWERSDFNEKDGNRFSYSYELDDLGRIDKRTEENTRNDRGVKTIEYEYDARSNPIRETETVYGGGGYGVEAVYKKQNVFNFYGECVRTVSEAEETKEKTVSEYTYACVNVLSVSSNAADYLPAADQWEKLAEAPELLRPDRCDNTIRFAEKSESSGKAVYTYRLTGGKEEAMFHLQVYQAILRDCCKLTFSEKSDGTMLILKGDTALARLETYREEGAYLFRIVLLK